MQLGEKLYKLRKEKGLSQEALAETIGTTRQAISKWENGQGYPETEKLLMLSNVFEVSVDFLLKDEKAEKGTEEKGYYVSRETAAGYVANEKKTSKFFGIGCSMFALAGVPYVLFQTSPACKIFGVSVCVLAGIIFFVISMFSSSDEYNIIKRENLLFDYAFLKSITMEYRSVKKKYTLVLAVCTIIFISGILLLASTVKGIIPLTDYHALAFLLLAVGAFGFVYFSAVMEAYEVLIQNEKYTSGLWFKLKHKMRNEIDNF